jgi:hypothetical protein
VGQVHRRSVTAVGSGNGGRGSHGRNRSLVVYGEEGLNKLSEEMEREEREKVLRARQEKAREDREKEKEPKRGRWSPRFFGGGDKGKEKERERASRVSSPIDGRATTPNGNATVSVPTAPGLARSGSRNARTSKHGSFVFEATRPISVVSSHVGGRAGGGGKGTGVDAPPMAPSMSRERSRNGKMERTVSFQSQFQSSQSQSHQSNNKHRPPSTSPRMHRRGLPGDPTTTTGSYTGPSAYSAATHPPKRPGTTTPTPPGPVPIGFSSSWGPASNNNKSTATNSSGGAGGGGNGIGSGNGKRRAVGLAHGSFAFEPAVPPPSSSPASEFGVIRSGDSGYQESAITNASIASTAPIHHNTHNGSGGGEGGWGRRGKGRSVDLNIGLSWAPTKVKPEAVLPSSFLEQNEKDRERRDRDREEEKRRYESGVSENFRNVLGEGGFATFKKCTLSSFSVSYFPFLFGSSFKKNLYPI